MNEFDAIYCYNLRGNQRTAGELSRKEGGKVFGSGSRSTVAVLILVKGGTAAGTGEGCQLHYRDIGDYLNREDKLRIVSGQALDTVEWQQISPSPEGDWINQRDERFATFQAIGEKDKALRERSVFVLHSNGLMTGRDSWVYNFSRPKLTENVESTIDFYNEQVRGFEAHCEETALASRQQPTSTGTSTTTRRTSAGTGRTRRISRRGGGMPSTDNVSSRPRTGPSRSSICTSTRS
ncbi:hypothetical protein O1L68_14020 [Streptomyces lydicus]|nr:hypothetical protein [Streptomyces lydicus]